MPGQINVSTTLGTDRGSGEGAPGNEVMLVNTVSVLICVCVSEQSLVYARIPWLESVSNPNQDPNCSDMHASGLIDVGCI